MINTKSISKAVKEYKEIKKRGNFPIIYFDCEEGETWCIEETDRNNWAEYDEDYIIDLTAYINEQAQELNGIINITVSSCDHYARKAMRGYKALMKQREEEHEEYYV